MSNNRATKQRILNFALLVLSAFVLSGCSDLSSSPPKQEIDKGVNWALSEFIDWRHNDRNLFNSYKITNSYTEKRSDGVARVYDFEADCLVRKGFQTDSFGSTKIVWLQALPNGDDFTSGNTETFKSTFTLIKKGSTWYRQATIR